jgi:hypothetical protein
LLASVGANGHIPRTMKITLPEGFKLPETAVPGEPFEAVATLKMEEDGSVELKALDGVEIPEEDETNEPEEMGEEMPENPGIKIPFEKPMM